METVVKNNFFQSFNKNDNIKMTFCGNTLDFLGKTLENSIQKYFSASWKNPHFVENMSANGDWERPCFDQLNAHILELLLFCVTL